VIGTIKRTQMSSTVLEELLGDPGTEIKPFLGENTSTGNVDYPTWSFASIDD